MNEREAIFALTHLDGIGVGRIQQLYSHFGSYKNAWESNPEEWNFLPKNHIEKIQQQKNTYNHDNTVNSLNQKKISYLTIVDPEYPELLKEISSPPVVLYYKGDPKALNTKCLGVVGTRTASNYGMQIIKYLIPELVTARLTIVSGFQRGIDSLAHEEAVSAKGLTIAVLGTGIDIPYPPGNESLFQKIIHNEGVIISEFPPGTEPHAHNFPQRNRIISGLSLGVLVIEAHIKSGSLITAQFAVEQNREVFAVPGSILSGLCAGPHSLIQKGAKLVYTPEDILSELTANTSESTIKNTIQIELTKQQKKLVTLLQDAERNIDELVELLKMEPGDLLAELSALEIEGVVLNLGTGRYACSPEYTGLS